MLSVKHPLAAIFGLAGPRLTDAERAFFADADPYGFILFGRNVETPDQVRALVAELRACVGREAPVLIDQEGGRVRRLKPPHWRDAPSMAPFVALHARDPAAAGRAVSLNASLLAAELADLGIDVDCYPLADVPVAGAHDIIGDRAFGHDPAVVSTLCGHAISGLLAGGVLPVIKHIPGHGRAFADSHLDLPTVDADRATLEATDFVPFKALAQAPYGMTAHIVYTALDPDRPATTSPTVIRGVVRGELGFEGLLMTDDLSMKALTGDFAVRAAESLAAGCDLVLHCNGDMDEMTAVARGCRPLDLDAQARVKRLDVFKAQRLKSLTVGAIRAELDDLLATA
ncbi:Beta N-acetyl-glucosaminidase [Caenispirillum salinarum AK4]|uniref:beta-N-acetylhexosaminidase n=1 Tax=Caenispirillum salinarum AK4 TaxID=1238182 RepID=K9HSV8_9PROT|nr:beta-N-acetylhexosaminidase [Caenispirillum salinarum]EKV31411.1 Beta N-acetyl-glucosaminidase [Caenispirillum salinarum AK4]